VLIVDLSILDTMDKFHGTMEENHPGEFLGDVLTLVSLEHQRTVLLMSEPF